MEMKPRYNLTKLKTLIENAKTRHITRQSIIDATSIGFSETEMVETVLSIDDLNFYKTMPSNKNEAIWQDVYHITKKGMQLYVKLQKSPGNKGVIISFKEK